LTNDTPSNQNLMHGSNNCQQFYFSAYDQW